ncbi:MAG: hypothetical protein KDC39_02570 [Actinobacteria bacterium]|nr:hypothetical protein [Actinomycetota bacterium]
MGASALLLTASGSAALGKAAVSVAVLRDGQQETATTSLGVRVRNRPVNRIALAQTGDSLVSAGQPAVLKYLAYRLGGPRRVKQETLQLHRLVPPALLNGRSRTKGKGAWRCVGNDCRFTRAVAVGKRLPSVGGFVQPTAAQARRFTRVEGAQATVTRWRSVASLSSGGKQALDNQLAVTRYQKPKKAGRTPLQAVAAVKGPRVQVKVTSQHAVRARGLADYQVTVNNGGSSNARNVRLRLRPPPGSRFLQATAEESKAWRCSGTSCQLRGSLASHSVAVSLHVRIQHEHVRKGRRALQAEVRWSGSRRDYGGRHRAKATGAWLAPLGVKLRAPNGRQVLGGTQNQTALFAEVSNAGSKTFDYAFKQLCSQQCPRVTWPGDRVGAQVNPEFSAMVEPRTNVSKRTKLRFQVKVISSDGAVATARTSLTVDPGPGDVATWDPNLASSGPPTPDEMQERLNSPRDPATDRHLAARPLVKARINTRPGITRVTPGRTGTLRLKVKPNQGSRASRVKKVEWTINGRPVRQVKHARLRKGGYQLRLKTPKREAKYPILVRTTLIHPKGRFTGTDEAIIPAAPHGGRAAKSDRATPQIRGVPHASPLFQPSTSVTSQGAQIYSAAASVEASTFCELFQDLADLAADEVDGTQFSVGSATITIGSLNLSTGSCSTSTASIKLSNSSLAVNGVDLTGLTATITSTGITLGAASITFPGDDTAIAISNVSLSAAWTSAGLQSLSGSLTLSGVPYFDLPDGWDITTATLSFASSPADLSLSLTASDTATNTTGTAPSATLSGTVSADETASLNMTVTNIFTLTSSSDSTVSFSGCGTVTGSSAGVSFGVAAWATTSSSNASIDCSTPTSMSCASPPSADFQLFDNVTLNTACVALGSSGLSFNGSADIDVDGTPLSLTLTGSATNSRNWNLSLSADGTASLGGMDLDLSAAGSLSYAEPTLSFSITAAVQTEQVQSFLNGSGLSLASASATLSNACPANDAGCKTSNVTLQLAITGTDSYLNSSLTVNTTILVDLSNGDFEFEVAVSDAFGPAELNLANVEFFAEDAGSGDLPDLVTSSSNPCTSTSSSSVSSPSPTGSSDLTVGFVASATVATGSDSTATFTVAAVYTDSSQSSYCLYGDATGNSLDIGPYEQGSTASIGFVYSSSKTVEVSGLPSGIPARTPTFWMSIQTPTAQLPAGAPSEIIAYLSITLSSDDVPSGFKIGATLDFAEADYETLTNNGTSNGSVQLTSLGLDVAISWGSKDSVSLTFTAGFNVNTPGAGTPGDQGYIEAASVPLVGQISFTAYSKGGAITLSVGTSNPCQAGQSYPNAFGISGFTLNCFTLSATLSENITADEFLFTASFTLETSGDDVSSFATDLGLSDDPTVTLTVEIGASDTCFAFSITPQTTGDTVLNWGGVITATDISFLMAPLGTCTTIINGTTTTSKETFAFVFDGTLLGDTVDVNIAIELHPNVVVDASINIGGFSLGDILTIDNTELNIDFSTSIEGVQSDLALSFSGGISLLDVGSVAVQGNLSTDFAPVQGTADISFNLAGSADASLLGIFGGDLNLAVGATLGMIDNEFSVSQLYVNAQAELDFLMFKGGAGIEFDYANNALQSFGINFNVGFDFFIGSIDGGFAMTYNKSQGNNVTFTFDVEFTLGFWIFKKTWEWSDSFTEPLGQPVDRAKLGFLGSLLPENATKNTWEITYDMYNDYYFMREDPTPFYDAIALASADSSFAWRSGQGEGLPLPAIETVFDQDMPEGYPSGITNPQIKVVNSNGNASVGLSGGPSQTNTQLEVTATLPQSPLVAYYQAQYPDDSSNWDACPSSGVTKTFTINLPATTGGDAASNWAWVMMDVNWRLQVASWLERIQVAQTMFGTTQTTTTPASVGYQVPTTPLPTGLDCGYSVFDDSVPGLLEFHRSNRFPLHYIAPNITTQQAESGGPLQPGWGNGFLKSAGTQLPANAPDAGLSVIGGYYFTSLMIELGLATSPVSFYGTEITFNSEQDQNTCVQALLYAAANLNYVNEDPDRSISAWPTAQTLCGITPTRGGGRMAGVNLTTNNYPTPGGLTEDQMQIIENWQDEANNFFVNQVYHNFQEAASEIPAGALVSNYIAGSSGNSNQQPGLNLIVDNAQYPGYHQASPVYAYQDINGNQPLLEADNVLCTQLSQILCPWDQGWSFGAASPQGSQAPPPLGEYGAYQALTVMDIPFPSCTAAQNSTQSPSPTPNELSPSSTPTTPPTSEPSTSVSPTETPTATASPSPSASPTPSTSVSPSTTPTTLTFNSYEVVPLNINQLSLVVPDGDAASVTLGDYYLSLEANPTAPPSANAEPDSNPYPYSLQLYNSSGTQQVWDGDNWVDEPTTQQGSAFSQLGQLYGASDEGVLYISSEGRATFLNWAPQSPFDISSGGTVDSGASVTISPTVSTPGDAPWNECLHGQTIFANPAVGYSTG